MRFMISQPIGGRTESEILETQKRAIEHLKKLGHEPIDTYFVGDEPYEVTEYRIKNSGLYWLGLSLTAMSSCDGVFFCKGWEEARGCRIEHDSAIAYGLQTMYE